MNDKVKDKEFIVGFSRSTKKLRIFSWIIRLYQGMTEYSHVFIKLKVVPRFPSNKILHAAEGQISHYSETAFLKRNEITDEFTINVCAETYNELKGNMFHELAGEPYSILQNVGIALTKLMRYMGFKNFKNPWTTGWNCSEYVVKILQLIFVEEFDHLDPNLVTPKELYKILAQLRTEGRIK